MTDLWKMRVERRVVATAPVGPINLARDRMPKQSGGHGTQ
jgi:hypothetical protein